MTKCSTTLALGVLLFGAALGAAESPAEAKVITKQSMAGKTTTRKLQSGVASWYGPGFHGRRTANGERFNTHALTAAHRSLPFGTRVKVVNQKTGRSVVVRINDRGPFVGGRVIDLSRASAQAIGIAGVAKVALVEM